jgi:hypothetical protein
MRQVILALCALIVFVVSFAVTYISFRTSAPEIRGVVGGSFFLLAALLLLWKDFAPFIVPKRVAGASQASPPPPQEPLILKGPSSATRGRMAVQVPASEHHSQELLVE